MSTPIYYDFEFVEDGRTIDPVSVGMADDDGREYYAVFSCPSTITRAVQHDWLRANVVASLPVIVDDGELNGWRWDTSHPDWPAVKPRPVIAREVRDCILSVPEPQLWAWYGAYDHVALCQLWGAMIDKPAGIPMFTCDLEQERARLGSPDLPPQAAGVHNALADARHNREIAAFLREYAEGTGVNW